MGFSIEELELINEGFELINQTGVDPFGYVITRDNEACRLSDIFKIHNLPGKVDNNGRIVPR